MAAQGGGRPGHQEVSHRATSPTGTPATQGTGTLAGQVAVVTGASQGIGRTIAEYLTSAGAAVALAARSADLLDDAVAAIERVGGRAIAVPLDVTDRRATMQLASAVEDRLGPIDLLVNNAGMDRVYGPMWEGDLDAWRQEFETNFFGPLLCTRAVVPGMVARGRGASSMSLASPGPCPRLSLRLWRVQDSAHSPDRDSGRGSGAKWDQCLRDPGADADEQGAP